MEINPIRTHKIKPFEQSIFEILDRYVDKMKEGSILAVTSKIVAICENRVVRTEDIDKHELIRKEAEYFLPPEENKYGITLTVKGSLLVPTAGIDESNGENYYILWPENPQSSANKIRKYLCDRFSVKRAGVIITDSKTSPLRWGTSGASIAHSGFSALNNYIGKPDIFGRKLMVTKANIADALATSAVLIMGEGNEQTPLAVIEKLPFVKFQNRNPSIEEIKDFHISMEEDLYAPLLKCVKWRKGGKNGFK